MWFGLFNHKDICSRYLCVPCALWTGVRRAAGVEKCGGDLGSWFCCWLFTPHPHDSVLQTDAYLKWCRVDELLGWRKNASAGVTSMCSAGQFFPKKTLDHSVAHRPWCDCTLCVCSVAATTIISIVRTPEYTQYSVTKID
jgi:hypothetical protein